MRLRQNERQKERQGVRQNKKEGNKNKRARVKQAAGGEKADENHWKLKRETHEEKSMRKEEQVAAAGLTDTFP